MKSNTIPKLLNGIKGDSNTSLSIASPRGGSRAGSLGGAQQLTEGGVVAEISFVSRSRPDSVGGGGSSINFLCLQKPARFSGGGGVVAEIVSGLQKPARFLTHIR